MPYDEGLASRIRGIIGPRPDVTERKMFGGLCVMTGGRMFIGVIGNDLMARVGPEAQGEALLKPGVRPMDFTGRPMKGFIYVDQSALGSDDALRAWIDQTYSFAAALPSPPQRPPRHHKTL